MSEAHFCAILSQPGQMLTVVRFEMQPSARTAAGKTPQNHCDSPDESLSPGRGLAEASGEQPEESLVRGGRTRDRKSVFS